MASAPHTTMRRALRREVAGTIGLLADEDDFAAMRRYRTFTFDDHETYLRQAEGLLRTLASGGGHTTIALFDPEEYEEYCADTGLDPDAPASRTRFTAELAATGPTVPYDGRPLRDLLPDLVDEAVRQVTWEYATMLLARQGNCAVCGEDIGRDAFSRASELLVQLLDTSGPGTRHLVCSVPTAPETLLATLHVTRDTAGNTALDETDALEFTTVLAVGIATHSAGGLVMRTTTEGAPDRVQGWRLHGERLEPLTAAEVFDAYCTDTVSGDLVAPESGVDYCAAPPIGDDEPEGGHRH
ncbi:hypothetical protein GCM10010277_65000 [Streptomyces longisporoflavus]|uniref:hypothetical protein n=1 Tax=Streptomyces longisporoflavus TaxID=28044 RepID=UPI00167E6A0A|nr:hypothetical protein [Streptomyces longisporoflavus]GGV60573.1 hypothetical protein GCM10010277_65000 [Streptomyces longisporoflavus]